MDFRVVADISRDLVTVLDMQVKCLYVNQAMEKATGIQAHDLIDKPLQE